MRMSTCRLAELLLQFELARIAPPRPGTPNLSAKPPPTAMPIDAPVSCCVVGGGFADRLGVPGLGGAMRANSNCNSSSASLQVDIRITDGKTGEERYAKHVTKTEQGQTVCGGRSSVDVSGLLRVAAQSVSMGLVTIMYPVKVVDVDADGQVVLNYGEGLLAAGDVFAVFQEGREIRDPDTGAVLGNSEKLLGLVKITEVMPKMSKATMMTAFPVAPSVGSVARAATPEQISAAKHSR